MTRNATWANLPTPVREDVLAKTGNVTHFDEAPTGNHAEIAGTLHTTRGRVFVKGARKQSTDKDGAEVWSLRNEAAINPHVQPYAPRLLWQVEAGGWLLLGFEQINGRHADYTPGSPDLEVLAKTIDALQGMRCPDVVVLRVERRYTTLYEDVSAMAGDALLHCDLNSTNTLITDDGRAFVVDWAFASRGAPWMELGFIVPWLLKAGHAPVDAEAWLSRFPAWADADPEHIDLFASLLAQQWSRRAVDGAASWISEYAGLVQKWANHRR